MGKRNLGERIHVVPIAAPAQISATTSYKGINMGLFNQVDFIIALGDLATDSFVLTFAEDTATTATSADAIAFEYRMSAAAGTDTMGAVTAVESTGLTLTHGSYDNMTVVVSIDSSSLTDTHKYVRPVLTDPGSATAYVAITALCYPRFEQATPSAALT